MKTLVALAALVCVLTGCAIVPAYPGYYGPAPVVVAPSVGFYYHRGYYHHW